MAKKHSVKGRKILQEVNSEPDLPEFDKDYKLDLIHALSEYQKFDTDMDTMKSWLSEYATNHFGPDVAKLVNKSNDTDIKVTTAVLARMVNRGAKLQENDMDKIDFALADLVDTIKKRTEAELAERKSKKDEGTQLTIRDRVEMKIREFRGEVDYRIDRFITNNEPFDIKKWFIEKEMGAPHVRGIGEHLNNYASEFKDATGSKDLDLKEGYSCFSTYKLRKLTKFLTDMISTCDTFVNAKVKTRKTRKKKEKSKDKIVSKMNYMKQCDDYKVVSIDPAKIVGSSVLVVFNARQKKIGFYVAESDQGLGVSGSTITNFDPSESVEYPVRSNKVVEVLKELEGARKRRILTYKKDEVVLSKAEKLSGRTSKNTILIQAV